MESNFQNLIFFSDLGHHHPKDELVQEIKGYELSLSS